MTTTLAIVTLIANALMGWLAFHNSAKATWIKFSFGILVVISVLASSIIVYNGNPVERVHFAITRFEPSTTPNWPIVGRELELNVYYSNVGNGIAYDTVVEGYTVLRPDYSLFNQEQAVSEFEKRLATRPLQQGHSIPTADERWSTALGAILTPEDSANIQTGRKVVFLIGFIQFRDDFGKHTMRFCRYIQPPGMTPDGGVIPFMIFASCEPHNNEVEGWIQSLKKT